MRDDVTKWHHLSLAEPEWSLERAGHHWLLSAGLNEAFHRDATSISGAAAAAAEGEIQEDYLTLSKMKLDGRGKIGSDHGEITFLYHLE